MAGGLIRSLENSMAGGLIRSQEKKNHRNKSPEEKKSKEKKNLE